VRIANLRQLGDFDDTYVLGAYEDPVDFNVNGTGGIYNPK